MSWLSRFLSTKRGPTLADALAVSSRMLPIDDCAQHRRLNSFRSAEREVCSFWAAIFFIFKNKETQTRTVRVMFSFCENSRCFRCSAGVQDLDERHVIWIDFQSGIRWIPDSQVQTLVFIWKLNQLSWLSRLVGRLFDHLNDSLWFTVCQSNRWPTRERGQPVVGSHQSF